MPVNPRSQMSIDQFNAQLRANPEYRAFLQSIGANPNGPLRLSDQQRKQAAAWVQSRFGTIGNLQVDPAGNLNQDEGWSKHKTWAIPAAIGAGTLGLGAFGIGPAAGLFGGGGGAGAASGAAGAAFDAAPAVHSAAGAANLAGITGTGLGGGAALGGVVPAAAAAGGSGIARSLLDNLLSPEGLLTAGSIAASLAGRGGGMNDQTRATGEQARRLQAITEARMRRVDPLHEAVTQLAFSRLPVSSRQDIPLPRVALPE